MQKIVEPTRETQVSGEYDVIVCGGGATGFIAAIAAARQGARTLLIEQYGILGGTATAAMMVEFGSVFNGKTVLVGGVPHEFMHRLVDFGGVHNFHSDRHTMVFDPESMIFVCQEMVLESGAELLLHGLIAAPIVEDGLVRGVIIEGKSGRKALLAKVVIDCTGDADVAARAGARAEFGRPKDRLVQPVTLEILLGNVDATRVNYSHHDLIPQIKAARASGAWPIPAERMFSWDRVCKRGAPDDPKHAFFFINGTNAVDIDGTDMWSLTKAEIETRRQVAPLIAFLQRHAPGFEKCYLDRTAVQVGIRETRRIVGGYTLMREDVLAASHFEDGVVPACNSIDVHDVAGKVFEHDFLKEGTYYEIPYRCFLPVDLEGILVAGRCLSADHWALGSARVMVVCMPMGEAVGIAAAMAAGKDCLPRAIPVAELKEKISKGGTVLSGEKFQNKGRR
ncbi:MAG: FAD-dependent oxidoreductase [Kiritimatiellia bacterium]|nr:FAD-dependent oxidoreductase [Kiritimatiellia bacterium]